MMPGDAEPNELEDALERAWPRLARFLAQLHDAAPPSVYASADIRDAGDKTVAVDTNAFPAGFNNLCRDSRKGAAKALRAHLAAHHPQARRLLLLPEDHTRNPFYLHNVHRLMGILTAAGIVHRVGSMDPEVVANVQGTADPAGHTLVYDLVVCRDGALQAGGEPVDLVLSNNDFTSGVPGPLAACGTRTIPEPRLGWATRMKAKHFTLYNHIARHAARLADVDPRRLTVETERHGPLDFKRREGLEGLADAVDAMLARLERSHRELGWEGPPRVFVKDEVGTYGMGIRVVASGDEVRAMNSRARQKMDKGKYGHKVRNVILQEAVPTRLAVEDRPAETVAYLIGAEPVGAFLRTHDERGALENLNAPGMRFLPLCPHPDCRRREARDCVERGLSRREELAARIAAAALAHEATPPVIAARDDRDVPLPALDGLVQPQR